MNEDDQTPAERIALIRAVLKRQWLTPVERLGLETELLRLIHANVKSNPMT
jgi:hypothetical protein